MTTAGKKWTRGSRTKTLTAARSTKATSAPDRQGPTLVEMKVTLDEVKPAVVRKLVIPTNLALDELHDVVQKAMGWMNCHMHAFFIPSTRESYGDTSMCDEDEDMGDETGVSVQELLARGVKKLKYIYDFGDEWRHTIAFGKMVTATPGARYPLCTGSEGACPPEDCGGPWGYAEKLEILADPKHEDYEETREWMESILVPSQFSVNEVNTRLHPRARPARPGPTKAVKPESKSANTRSNLLKRSRTPPSSKPSGKTIRTPSGFTITRSTTGDFIEINPGQGFESLGMLSTKNNNHFDVWSFFLGQIPAPISTIDVYTDPIPSTWGTKKMATFCKEQLNLKTTQGRAFLFFNSKRDLIRLYWNDGSGDQLLERALFEGTFIVPLTAKSGPWMKVPRGSLPKLLKASSGKNLPSPIRR